MLRFRAPLLLLDDAFAISFSLLMLIAAAPPPPLRRYASFTPC